MWVQTQELSQSNGNQRPLHWVHVGKSQPACPRLSPWEWRHVLVIKYYLGASIAGYRLYICPELWMKILMAVKTEKRFFSTADPGEVTILLLSFSEATDWLSSSAAEKRVRLRKRYLSTRYETLVLKNATYLFKWNWKTLKLQNKPWRSLQSIIEWWL